MRFLFLLPAALFIAGVFIPQTNVVADEEHAEVTSLAFGFERVPVVKTPFLVTDVEFDPTGAMWLLDKGGGVYRVQQGVLGSPVLRLFVAADKERGLLGITFDPDFSANGFVYLYYTTGEKSKAYGGKPKNRVSRLAFDAQQRVLPADTEKILLDNIASDAGIHNGGGIQLGPDHKLYVPTGDGGQRPQNAQDLNSLSGKILRLNLDGSVPQDNPFVSKKGARGEIWAYGLRNPWRISFSAKGGSASGGDATTQKLYATDVGSNKAEEVNLIEKGKNYGWPQTEGIKPAKAQGVTYPVFWYPHSPKGASIIGGAVYRGNVFPSEYQGHYFFGDFVTFGIHHIAIENKKKPLVPQELIHDAGGVIDITLGPDGALYLAVGDSPFTGHVEKVVYTGKALPVHVNAKIRASVTYGALPLKVQFTIQGKTDKKLFRYVWDFGDGVKAQGVKVMHTYRRQGPFDVKLAVFHGDDLVTKEMVRVFPGNSPPTLRITAPFKGLYRAGQDIKLHASAKDREDGPLPASSITWQASLGHGSHQHPLATSQGNVFTVIVPSEGDSDPDVHITVIVTAIDAQGLSTEKTLHWYPQKTKVILKSNIPGVEVFLDGSLVKTPYSFTSVTGFQRQLSAPEQVTVKGKKYTFQKWSQGGNREQMITIPSLTTTMSAIYSAL